MNESIGTKGKKKFYQQTNSNLFAFMIGCLISLTLLAYSKAQLTNYEFPTGNHYSISSVRESQKIEIIDPREYGGSGSTDSNISTKNQGIERIETIPTGSRSIDSGSNGSIEKTNPGGKQLVLVKGFAEDSLATMVATYAYELDQKRRKDFVIMMKCENGNFDQHLQSSVPDSRGPNGKEDSRGFCQLHRNRHSEIVDNPLFRNDRKRQVEQCYKKRIGGTKFYGPNRPIYRNKQYIGKCHEVVRNDFTLLSK